MTRPHLVLLKSPSDPVTSTNVRVSHLAVLATSFNLDSLETLSSLVQRGPRAFQSEYAGIAFCSQRSVHAFERVLAESPRRLATRWATSSRPWFVVGLSTKRALVRALEPYLRRDDDDDDDEDQDGEAGLPEIIGEHSGTGQILASAILDYFRQSEPLPTSTTTTTTTRYHYKLLFLGGDKSTESLPRALSAAEARADDHDPTSNHVVVRLDKLQVYSTDVAPEFERRFLDVLTNLFEPEPEQLEPGPDLNNNPNSLASSLYQLDEGDGGDDEENRHRSGSRLKPRRTVSRPQEGEHASDSDSDSDSDSYENVWIGICSPSGAKHVVSILRNHSILARLLPPPSPPPPREPPRPSSSSSTSWTLTGDSPPLLPTRRGEQVKEEEEEYHDDDDDEDEDELGNRASRTASLSSDEDCKRKKKKKEKDKMKRKKKKRLRIVVIGTTTRDYLVQDEKVWVDAMADVPGERGMVEAVVRVEMDESNMRRDKARQRARARARELSS